MKTKFPLKMAIIIANMILLIKKKKKKNPNAFELLCESRFEKSKYAKLVVVLNIIERFFFFLSCIRKSLTNLEKSKDTLSMITTQHKTCSKWFEFKKF